MREHRLPNGGTTTDQMEYCRAWEELAEPICKATGTVLHAFDPDVQIRLGDQCMGYRGVITLPPEFLAKLNEALK